MEIGNCFKIHRQKHDLRFSMKETILEKQIMNNVKNKLVAIL